MAEWIPKTERLPTGENKSSVWVTYDNGEVDWVYPEYVERKDRIIAWKPREQKPEPYVPPKPKRREWKAGHNTITVIKHSIYGDTQHTVGMNSCIREVLQGDPDPDVVLGVLEEMKRAVHKTASVNEWISRIEESRYK